MIYFANHQWELFAPLWLGWLLLFVVIEVWAILWYRKHPTSKYYGGTLSEVVWRLKKHPATRFILVVFFLVLALHFAFEI